MRFTAPTRGAMLGLAAADTLGVLLIAGACACWAIDNIRTGTRRSSATTPTSPTRIIVTGTGGTAFSERAGLQRGCLGKARHVR